MSVIPAIVLVSGLITVLGECMRRSTLTVFCDKQLVKEACPPVATESADVDEDGTTLLRQFQKSLHVNRNTRRSFRTPKCTLPGHAVNCVSDSIRFACADDD